MLHNSWNDFSRLAILLRAERRVAHYAGRPARSVLSDSLPVSVAGGRVRCRYALRTCEVCRPVEDEKCRMYRGWRSFTQLTHPRRCNRHIINAKPMHVFRISSHA